MTLCNSSLKRFPAIFILIFVLACAANIFAQSAPTDTEDRRVIVGLRVDGVAPLTAASRAHGTAPPGLSHAWGGAGADAELTAAIRNRAAAVLFQLGNTRHTLYRIYRFIPYMALKASPRALAILQQSADVISIEDDIPIPLPPVTGGSRTKGGGETGDSTPDQPMLDVSTSVTGADNAWALGYTGAGWYVAILDTGIRSTHDFFAGKTIVEACYAKGEDGTAGAGDCPDGTDSDSGPGAAAHYASSYSGYDHGTHVTGIAAGHSASLDGMAPDANIIAVQVFSRFTDCYSGTPGDQPCVMSWTSDQLAGLEHVYAIRGTYSIAAVNMSLGGGQYSSACDGDSRKAAIDNLRAAGIATAIASGNDGYCEYVGAPACISSSIAVGASTDDDYEADFNNWHPTMQRIFAPGYNTYSSLASGDSAYGNKSGTSMATPHVTGAWALIKQAVPGVSVNDALQALRDTGTGITSVCDGHVTPIPRIQVDQAILALTRSLSVTSPNGGESWPAGSVHAITWDCSGISDPLTIALLKDGVKVGVIASGVDFATGTYDWTVGSIEGGTVPAGDGYTVKIKVNNQAITDFSDTPFSIIDGAITVTAPAESAEWPAGESRDITWSAEGVTVPLTIALLKDDVKIGVIARDVPYDGLSTYTWTVGAYIGGNAAPGTGYTIKIKAQGQAITGFSPGTFAITSDTTLHVTSPTGSENWPVGTTRSITWSAVGIANPLTIALVKNGVKLGTIATNVSAGSGTYSWTVGSYDGGTAVPGTDYKIKIKVNGEAVTTFSPANFAIGPPSITVTAPLNNAEWESGTTRQITWDCNGVSNGLNIVLLRNGVKIGVIADGVSPETGSYSWTVGQYDGGTAEAGSGYVIKIKEIGESVTGFSNGSFSIQ